MKTIEQQVYERSNDLQALYGPDYRVEVVMLSPEAYAAVEIELSRAGVFAAPMQNGIRSLFRFRPAKHIRGGTAVLLNWRGALVGALELDLPPDVLNGGPFYSSQVVGIDLAAALASDTITFDTVKSKKIIVAKKGSISPDAMKRAPTVIRDQFVSKKNAAMQQLWDDLIRQTFGYPAEEPESPPEPLPVRRQTDGIIAYRTWELSSVSEPPTADMKIGDPLEVGYALRSLTANQTWRGPVLRADAPPADQKPSPNHKGPGHGIYAWKDAARAQPEWDAYRGDITVEVAGKVELRGRVVVHRLGYRAELARILELRLPNPPYSFAYDPSLVTALEERYQCDVRIGPWT